ncbi:MAG: NAD-dependent epimerase/dehydratase family protein [Verrucomicrobiota bacterium]|nr:NAD-dependent epimerase/dehydratase family protein [Verrucomicrobiota bacterium]
MKVLITGGAGFIGSHLAEYFQGKAGVRVLDNLHTGHRCNLEGLRVELIEGSILDEDAVARAMEGIDLVFHLAARISVPESMEKPQDYVATNVNGTLNVLEAAARAGVSGLAFASSAAVYGDNPAVPKVETMLPEPKSPYAITKLDGEYYCAMFRNERRLDTACLRFFNVFGPRQDPRSAYAAAVPIFASCATRNEPITIFGDGEQTRDFIYVKDVVAALAFVATSRKTHGVYNCGYGQRMTINDLARRIIGIAGSRSEVRYAPGRPGDVQHSEAGVDRLRDAGFPLTSSLDEGLAATVDYFKTIAPAASTDKTNA